MAVEKITKVDMFNAIADFIADTDWERKDEAIEFIEKQIDQLKAKAEKAKSRAEEKKVEGDELPELAPPELEEAAEGGGGVLPLLHALAVPHGVEELEFFLAGQCHDIRPFLYQFRVASSSARLVQAFMAVSTVPARSAS